MYNFCDEPPELTGAERTLASVQPQLDSANPDSAAAEVSRNLRRVHWSSVIGKREIN